MPARQSQGSTQTSHSPTSPIGIDESELWAMADALRGSMDAFEDIARVAGTYHRWRGEGDGYRDEPGFCRSITLEELRLHDHVLTPGRYVGAPPAEDDSEPFAEKMRRLVAELHEQQAESVRRYEAIAANLEALRFRSRGS